MNGWSSMGKRFVLSCWGLFARTAYSPAEALTRQVSWTWTPPAKVAQAALDTVSPLHSQSW